MSRRSPRCIGDGVKTWRYCGHPRTVENARKGNFHYGCLECETRPERWSFYIKRGDDSAMPPPYRASLALLDRHHAVLNKKLGVRVVGVLNEAEPLDRASYLLIEKHGYRPDNVAEWLGECRVELLARVEKMRRALATTEHQNPHKNWPLIQQLIDEGVPEQDVQDMIQITPNGWFKAKQRGDVRV